MSPTDLPVPTLIFVAIVVLYLVNSIKILREYERGVIFRLGRVLGTPKGPGIILVFRPLDQIVRITLRQQVLEVPAAGCDYPRQRNPEGERRGYALRHQSK